MAMISLALGDDHLYTYDGSGPDGLVRHSYPVVPVDEDLDYTVLNTLASTFVTGVLGSATKVVTSNYNWGEHDTNGKLPEPNTTLKGFIEMSQSTLVSLIKLYINKKVNTITGIVLPIGSPYMKYYCPKCGVLSNGAASDGVLKLTPACGHRHQPTSLLAYDLYHSLVEPAPIVP